MERIFAYYNRYQNVRGGLGGLPGWGRALVLIAAIPGIALLALSLAAVAVSIFALLVLTVPVYRLASALTPGRAPTGNVTDVDGVSVETPVESVFGSPVEAPKPRRQVDVRIVEEGSGG